MTHIVLIASKGDRYYWQCACGERSISTFLDRAQAVEEGEKHEYQARRGAHRVPTPRPTAKSLVKLYRERENQETYTPEERARWKVLADEIENQIPLDKKPVVIDGQLDLFDPTAPGGKP